MPLNSGTLNQTSNMKKNRTFTIRPVATLLTREYSTIDKQYEKKWYARGVGVIQEDAITKSKEHSEIVGIRR